MFSFEAKRTIVVLCFGDHVLPRVLHSFDVKEHVDGQFILLLLFIVIVVTVFIGPESGQPCSGATASSFLAPTTLSAFFRFSSRSCSGLLAICKKHWCMAASTYSLQQGHSCGRRDDVHVHLVPPIFFCTPGTCNTECTRWCFWHPRVFHCKTDLNDYPRTCLHWREACKNHRGWRLVDLIFLNGSSIFKTAPFWVTVDVDLGRYEGSGTTQLVPGSHNYLSDNYSTN